MQLTNSVSNCEIPDKKTKTHAFFRRLRQGPFAGLFHTFFCSIFLILSSVVVKKMTYISAGQLSLVRNAGVFCGCIPIAFYVGQNLLGPKKDRLMLLSRGILGATALYLNLLAYKLLPLAEASIILSTTPAMVMIGARVYLKETFGVVQCFSLFLTIIGVLMSVRIPELIRKSDGHHFSAEYVGGIASAIGCVFCLALAFITIRKMKDVHFSVLLIYMGFVGMLENASLTAAFSFYDIPRCGWDPFLMMSVGAFGFLGHVFMTLAIQSEAVGIVSVMRSSFDIVVALVFQVIFFGDNPDAYNACGAIIVIIAVSIIGINKWLSQLPDESRTKSRLKFLLI